jgi:hypothetical protein
MYVVDGYTYRVEYIVDGYTYRVEYIVDGYTYTIISNKALLERDKK